MDFSKSDITVTKIKYADLKKMEVLFEKEFGEEMNMDIVRARMRRLRQFYGILLPLRIFSPWIRGFWNIFVFRVKGNFAGFMQISRLNKKYLHLDFIAVSKIYRGKGLGRYILEGLLKEYADKGRYGVVLEARIDNPARMLYQDLGFISKNQILHYERKIGRMEYKELLEKPLVRFEILKGGECRLVYKLYRENIPDNLKEFMLQDKRSFCLNRLKKQMIKIKNKILKSKEHFYVMKAESKMIASVNIRSYAAASYHILTLYILLKYESYRGRILKQIIAHLSDEYGPGTLSITIYDDLPGKRFELENQGFEQKEAYYIMYRKAREEEEKAFEKEREMNLLKNEEENMK